MNSPVLDTIAAISTPPGYGGVGMVRISGPDALAVAEAVFTPAGGWQRFPPPPRHAIFGHIHPPRAFGDPIDQAVLIYFAGPASYTGEDSVELTAHGGPLIMGDLLEAAVQAGSRLAEPGEFTRRAFMNGRIDLSQAEAVASLIAASTDGARRVMLNQVEGAMAGEVAAMREALLETKVFLESAIDFPEDTEDLDPDRLNGLLDAVIGTADRLLETCQLGIALKEGLSAVIVGTPNVGKSSLLNALLEEERAIVHEMAGTTRDFIEGRIDAGGVPARIVDTAGIRQGADEVEVEGVLRTQRLMERADLLLVVLDRSRDPDPGDLSLLAETDGAPRVVVANKSDLPVREWVLPEGTIAVSARTGEGIDQLKGRIRSVCLRENTVLPEGAVVTSVRQKGALTRIADACRRARAGIAGDVGAECVAVDVDEALSDIGELTGEVTDDEVLDRIFENFCIGK